jgi:hypothetical protein
MNQDRPFGHDNGANFSVNSPLKMADQVDPSAWSSGWYLFEDGQIVGPLLADEAFTRSAKTLSGAQRMVSRKGFSQWYPLKDFAELHAMAGRYADHLADSKVTKSQDHLAAKGLDFDRDPSLRPNQVNTSATKPTVKSFEPVSRRIGPQDSLSPLSLDERRLSEALMREGTNKSTEQSSISEHRKLTKKERRRIKEAERLERKHQEELKSRDHQGAEAGADAQRARVGAATFDDLYILCVSRLRLGKMRSPFAAAVLWLPLTLFVYWSVWIAKITQEMSWHVQGKETNPHLLPYGLAIIPGVHFVFAYKVLQLTKATEMQNGYRNISIPFGMILAVFPPLFVHYVQSALSDHWKRHVAHWAHENGV